MKPEYSTPLLNLSQFFDEWESAVDNVRKIGFTAVANENAAFFSARDLSLISR
jgi:hypothetical protein